MVSKSRASKTRGVMLNPPVIHGKSTQFDRPKDVRYIGKKQAGRLKGWDKALKLRTHGELSDFFIPFKMAINYDSWRADS